jgi:asparagine synthase (glutamine-hydrolysing)
VEREKQGFGLPLAAWLRGPLRDWAESLLVNVGAPFNSAQVQRLWRAHLGGANHESAIWTVLMFQAWARQ